MLDHVGVAVADFATARNFFDAALAPLGIARLAGYGIAPKVFFWIGTRPAAQGGAHIAFTAADRATVDAFHRAALAASGRDNGAPGLRPHYHANYYGAFVLDPDGNNIEAVCHAPG